MRMRIAIALPHEREHLVHIWRTSNAARGLPPSPERVDRIREKLRAPDALALLARVAGQPVGMALAAPERSDGGRGAVVPGAGHVDMVFVLPSRWGKGVGTALMGEMCRRARSRGWTQLSVWTRETNVAGQRLYVAAGFQPTWRTGRLADDDVILELRRGAPVPGVGPEAALGRSR